MKALRAGCLRTARGVSSSLRTANSSQHRCISPPQGAVAVRRSGLSRRAGGTRTSIAGDGVALLSPLFYLRAPSMGLLAWHFITILSMSDHAPHVHLRWGAGYVFSHSFSWSSRVFLFSAVLLT